MFCPNCGRELKPADWYYNREKGVWECPCGVVIKEEWDFKKKRWKMELYGEREYEAFGGRC